MAHLCLVFDNLWIIWDSWLIIEYNVKLPNFTNQDLNPVYRKLQINIRKHSKRWEHVRLKFTWFCPLAQMRTLFALPSAHNVATKTSKNRNVTLTGFMCFHMLPLWNITCNSQQHVRTHELEAYCDTYCYYVISTSNFCHRLWICQGLDLR